LYSSWRIFRWTSEPGEDIVAQTQFPSNAPNNQVARYLYYLGRIRAIQLSYTEAQEHLISATRK
jgi:26S proteasome regulatory subunit N3